jgi:uncharacterized protein (TIRG00374 family)
MEPDQKTARDAANKPKKHLTARWRRWLVNLLKISAATAIIVWLVGNGHLNFSVIGGALGNWPQLLLLLAILYSTVGITSWRWSKLMRVHQIPVGLSECFSFSMIGLLVGLATPAGAGGDAAKVYFVQRHKTTKMETVISTVILDRFIGLLSLLLLGCVSFALNRRLAMETPTLLHFYGALGVATVSGFALLVGTIYLSAPASSTLDRLASRMPILRPFVRVANAVAAYRDAPSVIVLAFLLSLMSQFVICAAFALIVHIMGIPVVGVATLFATVPVALAATAIPLTPASIGVGQIAFFTLFQLMSGRGSDGANAFTIYQCVYIIMSLTGIAFYFGGKSPRSVTLEPKHSSGEQEKFVATSSRGGRTAI